MHHISLRHGLRPFSASRRLTVSPDKLSWSVSLRSAPGRGSSLSARSRLPSTKRRLVRDTVEPPTATARAISLSLRPASAASKIWARLSLRAARLPLLNIAVSSQRSAWLNSVESECGAVAVGRTYLLPPLSFGGALVVRPWLRFHIPLIEPDMQISRIRLSDKTSRLHPRHVVPQARQTHETHGFVEVRGRIGPVPAASDLVLVAQPPAQPRRRVAVDRPIRFVDGTYLKVVRPSAQRAVQLA